MNYTRSMYMQHLSINLRAAAFSNCSPDDRAALYIQVYTQTEEILTGEVV